jgi:hypothetical protein
MVCCSHEAKRVLRMGGTMGELDASDPDSDIPDELQVIWASGGHSLPTTSHPRINLVQQALPS